MELWKLKILNGMQSIKEGCEQVESWDKCNECPFLDYCEFNHDVTKPMPTNWEVNL